MGASLPAGLHLDVKDFKFGISGDGDNGLQLNEGTECYRGFSNGIKNAVGSYKTNWMCLTSSVFAHLHAVLETRDN